MHPAAVPATIGPYRVIRALGTGGWSTVYEVIGPGGETLACKRLRAELPDAALARFRREAESLRRIDHPGVLRLIDAGSDGGAPYLVTPRVDGVSLRELLARVRGTLGVEAALLLVGAAAEALGAIHAAGLVHRDIKPENLMVTARGEVVVIDLGLALGPEHSRHTEENALTGSVPYMAPEQIEDRAPTPASDVWALAVVLYEAALGRRPFQRERQSEEVAAILAGKCEPLAAADPRCDDALSALVARCLDPSPDRRPADGAALARELAAHVDWLAAGEGAAREGRERVAADPAGYAAAVAPIRAARHAQLARTALAGGDAFTASRHVDRALALAPDDPELRELLDAVMTGGPLAGETVPGAPPTGDEPDAGGTLVGFTPARPSAGHRVAVSAERAAVPVRYDSIGSAGHAGPRIDSGTAPQPAPPRIDSGTAPRPARRRAWIAIAAVAALAVIAAIGLAARYATRGDPPRDRAEVAPVDEPATTKPSRVQPSRPAERLIDTPPAEPDTAIDEVDEADDVTAPAGGSAASDGVVEKPSRVKPSRPASDFEKPAVVKPSQPAGSGTSP